MTAELNIAKPCESLVIDDSRGQKTSAIFGSMDTILKESIWTEAARLKANRLRFCKAVLQFLLPVTTAGLVWGYVTS